MGLLSWLASRNNSEARAAAAASALRQDAIQRMLRYDHLPSSITQRIESTRDGKLPWLATLTPSELRLARSHGIRPVCAVAATCWMHYGWSWTEGHAQGWQAALRRLKAEAKAAGANAVLDVKMRTVSIQVEDSMDFSLVGTAVKIDGLPPSVDPIVATVPAQAFVKLLESDVVPTGMAIGAHYEWLTDWGGNATMAWMGNIESGALSSLWETVRHRAHAQLREHASGQGNGVLAHVNFSQMFEQETGENSPNRFLARHIVIATTVDGRRGAPIPHEIKAVVDLHAGDTPLKGHAPHHQSYATNEDDGAI